MSSTVIRSSVVPVSVPTASNAKGDTSASTRPSFGGALQDARSTHDPSGDRTGAPVDRADPHTNPHTKKDTEQAKRGPRANHGKDAKDPRQVIGAPVPGAAVVARKPVGQPQETAESARSTTGRARASGSLSATAGSTPAGRGPRTPADPVDARTGSADTQAGSAEPSTGSVDPRNGSAEPSTGSADTQPDPVPAHAGAAHVPSIGQRGTRTASVPDAGKSPPHAVSATETPSATQRAKQSESELGERAGPPATARQVPHVVAKMRGGAPRAGAVDSHTGGDSSVHPFDATDGGEGTGTHGGPDVAGSASQVPGPAAFTHVLAHGMSPSVISTPTPPAHANLVAHSTPGSPQFVPEMAQHVTWLAANGMQQATIHLNPPNLGPVHVQVAHHQNLVDVSFVVQNPQTAQALQQNLPQLNQMLTQQGLSMGQATVGQQTPGERQSGNREPAGDGVAVRETGPADVGLPARHAVTRGRVDEFA